jgi:hypothetical protein
MQLAPSYVEIPEVWFHHSKSQTISPERQLRVLYW